MQERKMENEEIGYVFGSTAESALKFELAFNLIASGLERDFEKWVEEYRQNPPAQKPETRRVRLGMFRADALTPKLLHDLKQRFPGNEIFFVTTHFLRNAMERSGEFKCLGEVQLSRYHSVEPQSLLNRTIWVFSDDASKAPLWA
jgi:hypothetical protein